MKEEMKKMRKKYESSKKEWKKFSWVYKNICTLALVYCILHLWDDVGFALNGVVFGIGILVLEM